MFVRGIEKETLHLLLEMGKSSYPNEYMVMLGADEGIINIVYPIAGTVTGEDSASIFMDMIPLGMGFVGTAHSHPEGPTIPSDADLSTFAETGQVHIITGQPFNETAWQAYDRHGQPKHLDIL
ncbi:MAG: Mov34/MPN/PAD-1 family protein [Methanocorpusculum sp.]|nr:proteasome protein [Methanocorpusculum parvum]MBQ4133979.1 Mov34/MPN/PAD-1 family protein [Methanocorpusculum sp.]MBR4117465.1 Mov34/MPN/PAD-1 family protein [Methanocorpusculum sp.]HJJ64203.1 Mov34/MPN/PAD-1 family protein [Methanocorpusculum sp.]HJJ66189.1 Mov34/MPN/PAD-1 family protein [Methanocorpusculum sp.]